MTLIFMIDLWHCYQESFYFYPSNIGNMISKLIANIVWIIRASLCQLLWLKNILAMIWWLLLYGKWFRLSTVDLAWLSGRANVYQVIRKFYGWVLHCISYQRRCNNTSSLIIMWCDLRKPITWCKMDIWVTSIGITWKFHKKIKKTIRILM